MKKIITSLLSLTLLLAVTTANGQCPATPVNNCDLVDNGNFESNSGMPISAQYNPGQLTLACPWNVTPVNTATPDYFSTGAPGGIANTFWVPTNIVGTETAHGGNGYAGYASYFQPVPGLREYVAEPLRCSLIAGVTYNLTFWVSLADNSKWQGAVSAAVCATLPSVAGTGAVVPVCPAANVVPTFLLATKVGWTPVNLTFVATGGEQFIIIGNFNPVDPGAQDFPASTYVGAYVYVDDVSLTPVQNLSITATPSTVACGGTTTLTNNYGATINYLGGTWNCAGCVSPTTPALTTSTLFMGIITYCTGCSQIATTTVNVTPMTITASATPSTLTPPSTTTSFLSSTATGGTGITYSWSPTTGLNNPAIANPVATPTVTTIYTVTATNSAGCTASTTVTVTVTPQSLCTLTYNYDIPAGSVSSTYFPSITGLTGQNIRITGVFTIDAYFNFSGCNIEMEPGSSIEVSNGATIYITGQTHIFSCAGMWNGINLQNGTSAQIMNSSIIEDAVKAVKINQGASAQIQFCTFNRNYTAVELTSNTSAVSPLSMLGCVITSRNIPFSPSVTTNPNAATIWSNIVTGTYASINMKSPFYSYKSIYGVFATDVNMLKVGSDLTSTNVNGFDNLASTGIYLTRSNTTIYNNQFRSITNASNCFTCTPLIGMGVYAIGNTTTNYSLKVGGTLANQPNTFTNVYSSVDASNYQINLVQNNTITNTTTTTTTYGGYGKNGIRISPMASNTVTVSQNIITNCAAGIAIYRNNTTSGQTVNLTVDNNSVNANSTGFCTTAIYLADASSAVLTSGTSEINFNTIIESANCISLLNVKAKNDIMSNSCMTRYAATGNINGIKLSSCQQQTVMQNHTKYNVPTAGLSGGNPLAYGIYLLASPNNAIRCNTLENAAGDLVFSGNCVYTHGITQNTMRNAQNGMVLLTTTTDIGIQGIGGTPSNNYFDTGLLNHINTAATTPVLTLNVTSPGTTWPTLIIGTTSINPVGGTLTACGPVPARLAAPEESQEVVADENGLLFVYPNPSNGSFTIETYSTKAKDVFVYDVMGKLVFSNSKMSESNISVDITEQPAGIYIVQVVNENSVETKRVIKQ